ncbi:MAG: molecular chaperone, partial [Methanosarcinales archaeon]
MALEFGTLTDIEKVSTTKEIDGFADPRLTTMYKFFSAIYLREPSKDFIEKILEREFITYLSEIFKEGAKILKNFAETFDGKLEQYEELVVEYNSLFNVLLEQYVAPYESAYREGLLYIHAVEVKKFYESNGFAISEDYKDLPDHVG